MGHLILNLSIETGALYIVPYAKSLDPDETLSYSASHPDPICLTLRQHFHQQLATLSTMKIEADEKFSRQQFI